MVKVKWPQLSFRTSAKHNASESSIGSYVFVRIRTSGPEVGVVGRKTHLIHLEPTLLVTSSGSGISDLGHVDVDRAVVIAL